MQIDEFRTYPFGTIPKRLNDFFKSENRDIVGRTDELAQVRRDLLEGRATVLMNGIGGIGKTTIARKYVEQHWDDYQHIAWLTVNAPQSVGHDPHQAAADEGYSPLRDAFLRSPALWRSLGIDVEVEQQIDGKDLRGAFDLIRQRLGQLQDCLLIIDNANDAADLLENRPALKSLNAHVLVTSRAKPKEWNIVEVNELPLPLAVELFKQHYAHPSLAQASDADLNALAETLLLHTLLLELVGKSASPNGNNLPFPQLVENLQDKSFHNRYLNELPVDGGDHADGQNLRRQATVESYIALMFSHIRWEEPERRDLLKAMTLLPPAQAYGRDFLTEICQLLDVDFQPNRAEFLVQYGWLSREPLPEGGVGYSMHPLILDVAFRELGVTAEWADGVILYIAKMIHYDSQDPQDDFLQKRNSQNLADHLSKVFWDGEIESVSSLLNSLAVLEKIYGYYKYAVTYAERSLAIAEKIFFEEAISTLRSNLANIYTDLGDFNLARDILERVLATELKKFGLEHPNVAACQTDLGEVYRNLGKHVRARELLEAALPIELKYFGNDHPRVAICQSNLANVYNELGDFTRARDMYNAALVIELKNFDPEHPRVAIRQSNLATAYRRLGEFAHARELLKRALASDLKNFGSNHPEIAVRYNNLAQVYKSEKNFPAAIEHFQEALRIVEITLGREHPRFHHLSENLEAAQREAGE